MLTKKKLNLQTYKRDYYQSHLQEYRKRNKQASEEKTLLLIEKLSTPYIIYKLDFILKHHVEEQTRIVRF
jgi:hypothetical protein